MSLHPAVAEVVASRRLGSLDASRHRFTVSREQALLQLRAQAKARAAHPWAWTLPLVRAANSLSDVAECRITTEHDEATVTTLLDVIVPGFELGGLDMSDMLAGALDADLGEPIHEGLWATGVSDDPEPLRQLRLQRFRMLIGRAINEALGHEPLALELRTSVGGRRFEKRESVSEGRDPYGERKTQGCVGASRFVVAWVEPRPSWGARLGRWLRGRSEVTAMLAELWSSQQVRETDETIAGDDGQLLLGPSISRPPIALGRHALFGSSSGLLAKPAIRGSLWLVRDGLRLVELTGPLREAGLPAGDQLAGWIDCPSLRLTADEQSVVRDAAFELLAAWLADALAHRVEITSCEGGTVGPPSMSVRWPSGLEALVSASERPITSDSLESDVQHGRELVYVWRHQARNVPAWARARVLAPWPSELERLRERFPSARLVPLRALGGQIDFDPADLTSLRAGSYEPLVLARDSRLDLPGELVHEPGLVGVELHVAIEAYVHRSAAASMGFIELLAYERRVAQIRERVKIIPGVTLIARLSSPSGELDVPALRRAHALIGVIVDQVRRKALDHREALLAHVIARANPWENPFVRGALDELTGVALELAYKRTEAGLRLSWKDSVLLDVVVASDHEGRKLMLRDALRQVREPGLIVSGRDDRSWTSLHSSDVRLRPWKIAEWARPLVERVIGAAAILDMPTVAEAYPLVGLHLVDDQRHLLRSRDAVATDLERKGVDRLARLRLLGQLLVARGLGADTMGLESVVLLERYDPRALSPTRLVSLAQVLAERPMPGMVPVGAVHRGLSAPVIEVLPGLAALLHEVAGLEPHVQGSVAAPVHASVHGEDSRGSTPIRRRARELPPLLAKSVVDSLFVGRLQVAGDGSSDGVALWAKGLRVGEVQLDEPLGRVSGRLWLTIDGQRAGPLLLRRQVTELARELVADALRQRALLAPEGPQRRRLDHFVEYARTVVRKQDSYQLADLLGAHEVSDRAQQIAKLKQMSLTAVPLRPLSPRRDALLADIVRQSLAMPVHFDAAILQWRAAKLGKRRRDGSLELEFGLRNAWIQRALDEEQQLDMQAHRQAALQAAVIVVAEFFFQARANLELELGEEHLVVALWRLLRLV